MKTNRDRGHCRTRQQYFTSTPIPRGVPIKNRRIVSPRNSRTEYFTNPLLRRRRRAFGATKSWLMENSLPMLFCLPSPLSRIHPVVASVGFFLFAMGLTVERAFYADWTAIHYLALFFQGVVLSLEILTYYCHTNICGDLQSCLLCRNFVTFRTCRPLNAGGVLEPFGRILSCSYCTLQQGGGIAKVVPGTIAYSLHSFILVHLYYITIISGPRK